MKKQDDFIATVCEAVAIVEPQTERAELCLTQHFRPEELHIGFLLIEQSRLAELCAVNPCRRAFRIPPSASPVLTSLPSATRDHVPPMYDHAVRPPSVNRSSNARCDRTKTSLKKTLLLAPA